MVLREIPRDREACVECSFQGFAMVLFAVPLLSLSHTLHMYDMLHHISMETLDETAHDCGHA